MKYLIPAYGFSAELRHHRANPNQKLVLQIVCAELFLLKIGRNRRIALPPTRIHLIPPNMQVLVGKDSSDLAQQDFNRLVDSLVQGVETCLVHPEAATRFSFLGAPLRMRDQP